MIKFFSVFLFYKNNEKGDGLIDNEEMGKMMKSFGYDLKPEVLDKVMNWMGSNVIICYQHSVKQSKKLKQLDFASFVIYVVENL